MVKLSGLFDAFDNLDQIPIELISRWIKPPPPQIQLENYLANRILYPQTAPMSEYEMQIDLAILREALRLNGPKIDLPKSALLGNNAFLNTTLRKVVIPAKFLNFVPDLPTLVWVFIDGLLLGRVKADWFDDLWTVNLSGDSDEVAGSIIIPQFSSNSGNVSILVQGKNYNIKAGSLAVIPCLEQRCQISYKFNQGKILGKNESALEIYGGNLGLMVDGRIIKR